MPARRREHDLLLLCVGRHSGDVPARIEEVLREGVDWAYLLRVARAHKVMPLLHCRLQSIKGGLVPEEASRELRDAFQRNRYRNVFLLGALLELLGALEERGIDAIPYKGPSLAVTAYGNIGLRQFDDLDVVVRGRDLVRAKEALFAHGFRPYEPWSSVDELNYEYHLIRDDGRVRLDVHGEVFSRAVFPLSPRRLWERLRRGELGGREVLGYSPEDLLLILCVHADSHVWHRLAWICDVAWLMTGTAGMDWKVVLERARATGTRRILFVGLRLAHELLGAELPSGVLEAVRRDEPSAVLAGELAARLFETRGAEATATDLETSRFQWRSRERLRDRLRMVLTPNEGDWAAMELPRSLAIFYYLSRPFRLVAKYGVGRFGAAPRGSRTAGGSPA